jgi:ParB/RepB/Spo0J family partition protein
MVPARAENSLVELREIRIDLIETPRRPVRRFLGDVAALAESMQDFGLQQPISVRVDGNRYFLTSGLRRLTAARLLQWQTITAFVRNVNADEAYVLDLIENLQREDLSPEEEADALGELIRTRGWTLQQVADTIKRSVGYVSKRVRLFEDTLLREAVVSRGMPVSTAEELLAAPAELRTRLVEQALAERWDQVRARDELRAPGPPVVEVIEAQLATSSVASTSESSSKIGRRPLPARSARSDTSSARPRGFTRAIHEFHRLINELRAQDLTPADRSALRALFRDLLLLARAPTSPGPPVFPPLPATKRKNS